jgi:hypothetical protein
MTGTETTNVETLFETTGEMPDVMNGVTTDAMTGDALVLGSAKSVNDSQRPRRNRNRQKNLNRSPQRRLLRLQSRTRKCARNANAWKHGKRSVRQRKR